MDSWEKFEEKQLPEMKDFYSKLTKSGITNEDYEFVNELWTNFKLRDLVDLHNLYMSTDVMLLADVFEGFRAQCLKKYKLDPAQFMTAPSLSWLACLKLTKVTLELITNPDMSMFIDKS